MSLKIEYVQTNMEIEQSIKRYIKKKCEAMFLESKNMIIAFKLTESDYFFYEIYNKIRENLKNLYDSDLPQSKTNMDQILYEEAKAKVENRSNPQNLKQALLLMNVALDLESENQKILETYNEVLNEYQKASFHSVPKYK